MPNVTYEKKIMDSNAIEEIANQLGVGTDYLLNHLSEFASKWAAMRIATSTVGCVIAAIVLVVSACLFVNAMRSYRENGADHMKQCAPITTMLAFGIVAVCALIFLSESAINIMTHVMSPEAAMVNDILAVH